MEYTNIAYPIPKIDKTRNDKPEYVLSEFLVHGADQLIILYWMAIGLLLNTPLQTE